MTLGTAASQVNLVSANYQATAAVDSAPDGRSVTVWEERLSSGPNQGNIRGWMMNKDGVPIGFDLGIATTTLDESDPAVAIHPSGEFVVTWTRKEVGAPSVIRAERFTAASAKVGGAILVSDPGIGSTESDFAMKSNADFVVAYSRKGFGPNPTFNSDVVVNNYSNLRALQVSSRIDGFYNSEFEPIVAVSPSR